MPLQDMNTKHNNWMCAITDNIIITNNIVLKVMVSYPNPIGNCLQTKYKILVFIPNFVFSLKRATDCLGS